MLHGLGLQALASGLDDLICDDWWDNLSNRVAGLVRLEKELIL